MRQLLRLEGGVAPLDPSIARAIEGIEGESYRTLSASSTKYDGHSTRESDLADLFQPNFTIRSISRIFKTDSR